VQKESFIDPTAEWNNYGKTSKNPGGKDQSRAYGKLNKFLEDSGVGVDMRRGPFDKFRGHFFKSSKD